MLSARDVHLGPLAGVDLDLMPGLTVVTGEADCGTSTLLRVLAGVDRPDAGVVEGASTALLGTPPGSEWEDGDVVTEALGAPHLVGREMRAMSAGERQRVRLATVLSSSADVLLLDEPLGLLDAGGRQLVMDTLRADGRPVLIACKSDPAVLALADRVLTLADGRLT